QRALGEALAVGRIEKDEPEDAAVARSAEMGGVAAVDLGDASQGESLDIAADHRAGIRLLFDEQAVPGAARQRFEAKRAGAGEEIEHADAVEGEARDAVRENIKDRLTHAVGGGAGAV